LSLLPALLDAPPFMVSEGIGIKPVLTSHFQHARSGFQSSSFFVSSFRQGGATFAFNCSVPSEFIKAQGDWQSDAYLI